MNDFYAGIGEMKYINILLRHRRHLKAVEDIFTLN